jgi:CheY-like chemotaxis protein/predicted hydrocarbon binding protein
MSKTSYEKELEQRVLELEQEVNLLKRKKFAICEGEAVSVPDGMKPIFDAAQNTVHDYFSQFKADPTQASIEIGGQRYLLMRASSLSIDFFKTITQLYSDKSEEDAFKLGATFLFDISHVIGVEDGKAFHEKMKLTDPIAKLSAGPVHFAYSGWAYVNIDPSSQPSPDDNFILKYTHPYSFEADSWIKAGRTSLKPVCIMNSGYSSGWCEESFGIPLTAVEVTCRACGDDECSFIMSPPHMIEKHLEEYKKHGHNHEEAKYSVPTFFERKKVEEEMHKAKIKAEESDRAKSEFLANMSHEMRTPLNAIKGYINILQKEGLSIEHQDYLKTISHSSDHLLTIINDILDLSKIEAGELLIVKESCSLKELLEDSYATLLRLLDILDRSVNISYNIDPAIIDYVLVDSTRLKQILYNLLSNALKFTQEGFIDFGVKLDKENNLLFYVKDSGVGVALEMQETIFSMFGQVDASSTRAFGGTGLGLTITKKLVEGLGGKIWIESELGKGASFYFTQAYIPTDAPLENKKTLEKPLLQTKLQKNILLVEDNLVNQKLTQLVLNKAGFTVLKAFNGQEAVDIYKSSKRQDIDLILMDVQMPILNGLSATNIIRAYEEEHDITPIAIIALTAQAMQGDMAKCLEAGCNDYLTKPISIDSFIDIIIGALADNKDKKV